MPAYPQCAHDAWAVRSPTLLCASTVTGYSHTSPLYSALPRLCAKSNDPKAKS